MTAVVKWSGREARALREAHRMGVRAFASHLGFNDAAVSNWEARGKDAKLRHHTQEVLDTDLATASADVRARFERALAVSPTASGRLGAESTARTRILLDSLRSLNATGLPYQPPPDAAERLRDFVASASRVYLITGPAGCGKTQLTYFLADQVSGLADVQLLSAGNAETLTSDVAVEILRYGSLPYHQDALLSLESETRALARPCVVMVDGITAHGQFDRIARQVDAVLRQVTSHNLRFVLIIRTPPAIDTTIHPVLHATVFTPPHRAAHTSYEVTPWTLTGAAAVWNASRAGDDTRFDELPSSAQQLARVPLYMQLMRTAGASSHVSGTNAYALIDHCVRTILHADGDAVDQTIAVLADVAENQLSGLIPHSLLGSHKRSQPHGQVPQPPGPSSAALIRPTAAGELEFTSHILREFFLASRLVDLLRAHGRLAMVNGLNDLAEAAVTSATARTVVDLTITGLDITDPDALTAAVLAPTMSITVTVPLMLTLATTDALFVTADVLRACARRCEQDCALALAQALLTTPAVFPALGPDAAVWLIGLLRRFGASVWDSVQEFVEQHLDAADAHALLDTADLADGDEAAFFARYFFLFSHDVAEAATALESLLSQQNWRVRAALAEALRDPRFPSTATTDKTMSSLIHDDDYKVRAAAALAVHRSPSPGVNDALMLLTDENWHVRGQVLHGLLVHNTDSPPPAELIAAALSIVSSEPSWARCPAHIQPVLHRVRLLHGDIEDNDDSLATRRALFSLLREARTGWTPLPHHTHEAIVSRACRSAHWLVRREADAFASHQSDSDQGTMSGHDNPDSPREAFRKRRNRHAIQVALDMHDLEDAVTVARAAASAGVDFLEIGDPLIKEVGVHAIERIKEAVPETLVVAEMMSADWGRDQVVLAAEAGADVVLLIGPATAASVSAAVDAGRRLGVPILLDVPAPLLSQQWIATMERVGVDGFTVTTNIDVGIGSKTVLSTSRAVRVWTQLPVAVSGGFSTTDQAIITSPDWDILIVGRSITDAVEPATTARRITEHVHRRDQGHR